MKNWDKEINVNKVARQCKRIGEFIMFKSEAGNLLVTNQFVLSLTPEQFWKVQCKLEIPERGRWYLQQKDGAKESDREPEIEKIESKYNEWLQEKGLHMEYTSLILQNNYLYADNEKYTAVNCDRMDMVEYTEELNRISTNEVVVDGMHVISPAKDLVWQENNWLK